MKKLKTKEDQLANSIREKIREIDELKEAHASVFDSLTALEEDKLNLEVQLKDLVRRKAIIGETTRIVDLPDIIVEVRGEQAAQEYDTKKAAKYWPEDVYKHVLKRYIDTSELKKLVESGQVDETVLGKAALPREPRTPKVFIRAI